jgi:serine/threonine-protein kinase
MDSTRWERVQSLFHQAAELPPEAQTPFLEEVCAGDEALLVEVVAMLGHDAGAASLLDRHVADVAGRIMGQGVPAALADQMFGPYRLTRLLGEGGMGIVCLGVRDDLGRMAAIKILRDAWISPARRERFATEQRILAHLNHPAIARLYDADTLPGGTPWLAMEYVEGVPLTEHCRARGTSAADRLRAFRDVCEAVQHAHQHMVVHRDLKPSNILVTPDGGVKLLDFGISRQLDAIDRAATPTIAAMRLLTPAYAAPEQIRGEATTVQTDVYALGVILYELLAGRTPFDLARLPPEEAERTLLEGEPLRPSLVARQGIAAVTDLSAAAWSDLDVVCLTAMHKDLAHRYRSVEALIRDIIWRANRSRRAPTRSATGRASSCGETGVPLWRLRPRSFSRSRSWRSTRSSSLLPEMPRSPRPFAPIAFSVSCSGCSTAARRTPALPTTFAW